MKQNTKWLIVLHGVLLLYALSSVLSKAAAGQPTLSLLFILMYGGVLLLLMLYAVGWQQVIKHLKLTTAYANKAVTVIWGIVFGVLLFHESLELKQVAGAVIILAGLMLYVKADKEAEHD